MSMIPENLPLIQQISLGEGSVEIVYVEARDREIFERTGVMNSKVKNIPIRYCQDELLDLIDSAIQVLDASARAERDAPDSFRR